MGEYRGWGQPRQLDAAASAGEPLTGARPGGVSIAYKRLVPLPGSEGVRTPGSNAKAGELRLVVQTFPRLGGG
jgi:hypothetical protein